MATRHFGELLNAQWDKDNFLCVGLDPDYEKIPEVIRTTNIRGTLFAFNRAIIDATHEIACSYKPNSAFYEMHGEEGFVALRETIRYINETVPETPVILDCKRGDIGNTNEYYARAVFDYLNADAVTLHPYTGAEGLAAFLEREEKGFFIYCRSSNPGAKEFQDLVVDGKPLYMHVAKNVATSWNDRGNCGLIVGATYPDELRAVRKIASDVPILIPGIGAQGGDLAKSVVAAKDSRGRGFVISASRSIAYASAGADFAQAAEKHAQELDSAIRKAL